MCVRGFYNGRRGKPSVTLGEPPIRSVDRCDTTARNTEAFSVEFERLLQGACRGNVARGVEETLQKKIRRRGSDPTDCPVQNTGKQRALTNTHTLAPPPPGPLLGARPVEKVFIVYRYLLRFCPEAPRLARRLGRRHSFCTKVRCGAAIPLPAPPSNLRTRVATPPPLLPPAPRSPPTSTSKKTRGLFGLDGFESGEA